MSRSPSAALPMRHLIALDVIQHALGVAIRALVADFPDILGAQHVPARAAREQLAARHLLEGLTHFEHVVATYRRRFAHSDERDDG